MSVTRQVKGKSFKGSSNGQPQPQPHESAVPIDCTQPAVIDKQTIAILETHVTRAFENEVQTSRAANLFQFILNDI